MTTHVNGNFSQAEECCDDQECCDDKKQRVKASMITKKTNSLRKSASVQVDLTSKIINQLLEDRETLLSRLVQPKTRKTVMDHLESQKSFVIMSDMLVSTSS
uniref:Uncharacterized protein n=1 Tax=Ditylenchus dipsaci TaxID=166011 RepID=A0A915ED98_9BILA